MHESVETFRIPGTFYRLLIPMLAFGLLPIGIFVPTQLAPGPQKWLWIGGAVLLCGLLLYRYAWRGARAVDVSRAGLRLRWAFRSRWIPADQVADVQLVIWETITPPAPWTADGLHGLWDSPDLGPVEMYATHPGSMALIHLRGSPPLLLGVEFADELVEAVEADILGRSNLY